MKIIENTLEIDLVKRLGKAKKIIEEVLISTQHDNRDTRFLFNINRRIGFIIGQNLED